MKADSIAFSHVGSGAVMSAAPKPTAPAPRSEINFAQALEQLLASSQEEVGEETLVHGGDLTEEEMELELSIEPNAPEHFEVDPEQHEAPTPAPQADKSLKTKEQFAKARSLEAGKSVPIDDTTETVSNNFLTGEAPLKATESALDSTYMDLPTAGFEPHKLDGEALLSPSEIETSHIDGHARDHAISPDSIVRPPAGARQAETSLVRTASLSFPQTLDSHEPAPVPVQLPEQQKVKVLAHEAPLASHVIASEPGVTDKNENTARVIEAAATRTPPPLPSAIPLEVDSDLAAEVDPNIPESLLDIPAHRTSPSAHQPNVQLNTITQSTHAPISSIATQIQVASSGLEDGTITVSLSPEELGKVRLSMVPDSQGGLTLHVVADRPETLDLLRRNMSDLSGEFSKLGYTSIDLSFSSPRDDGPSDQPGSENHDEGLAKSQQDVTEQPTSTVAQIVVTSRLNMVI